MLIERRQKVLNIMKGYVEKMKSDSGKEFGNTLVEFTETKIMLKKDSSINFKKQKPVWIGNRIYF